jgi:hypothetical protein
MPSTRDPKFNGTAIPVKRGRGRPLGSKNKMGRDLMALVMQAAENVGYIERDGNNNWVATRKGGVLAYLEWAAVHKAERFLALMGRVAPKQTYTEVTHRDGSMTDTEIEAELRERGLPVDLLPFLLKLPVDEALQEGEDPDPYGLKPITPSRAGGLTGNRQRRL